MRLESDGGDGRLAGLLLFVVRVSEAHDRGNAEGTEPQQADDRTGKDERAGDAYLVGQESRGQQPEGRGEQAETVVERHDAPQDARIDPALDHRDERGVEDAARDAGSGRQQGEADETRGGQQTRQEERKTDHEVHQVDQYDAADAVFADAHDGAAEQRASSPDDLHEAHLCCCAPEMAERHEREEYADGHDEEPHGDGQREEPAHAGSGVHGGKAFAEFAPQVGTARAPFRVGDTDEEQGRAGGDGADDVEQQDVADRREVEQQGAQGRSGDVGERDDDLIDSGDAREFRLGGQHRHRGLHGRAVEGRAGRAACQQQVDVPHLRAARPEEHGEQQRAEGDEQVGGDHRAAAVPSVDVDAHDGTEERLRQHAGDGR